MDIDSEQDSHTTLDNSNENVSDDAENLRQQLLSQLLKKNKSKSNESTLRGCLAQTNMANDTFDKRLSLDEQLKNQSVRCTLTLDPASNGLSNIHSRTVDILEVSNRMSANSSSRDLRDSATQTAGLKDQAEIRRSARSFEDKFGRIKDQYRSMQNRYFHLLKRRDDCLKEVEDCDCELVKLQKQMSDSMFDLIDFSKNFTSDCFKFTDRQRPSTSVPSSDNNSKADSASSDRSATSSARSTIGKSNATVTASVSTSSGHKKLVSEFPATLVDSTKQQQKQPSNSQAQNQHRHGAFADVGKIAVEITPVNASDAGGSGSVAAQRVAQPPTPSINMTNSQPVNTSRATTLNSFLLSSAPAFTSQQQQLRISPKKPQKQQQQQRSVNVITNISTPIIRKRKPSQNTGSVGPPNRKVALATASPILPNNNNNKSDVETIVSAVGNNPQIRVAFIDDRLSASNTINHRKKNDSHNSVFDSEADSVGLVSVGSPVTKNQNRFPDLIVEPNDKPLGSGTNISLIKSQKLKPRADSTGERTPDIVRPIPTSYVPGNADRGDSLIRQQTLIEIETPVFDHYSNAEFKKLPFKFGSSPSTTIKPLHSDEFIISSDSASSVNSSSNSSIASTEDIASNGVRKIPLAVKQTCRKGSKKQKIQLQSNQMAEKASPNGHTHPPSITLTAANSSPTSEAIIATKENCTAQNSHHRCNSENQQQQTISSSISTTSTISGSAAVQNTLPIPVSNSSPINRLNGYIINDRVQLKDIDNVLINFRSYKFTPGFPIKYIKHPAIANRIDPFLPLCPYQLRGRCADSDCPWQHESEYKLTDEEILLEIVNFYPNLCPNGTSPDNLIKRLLSKGSLDTILPDIISKIPKERRKIQFTKNLLTNLKPKKPVPECADDQVKYSPVSGFLSSISL